MRRLALIGIPVALVLLLFGAVLFVKPFRLVPLTTTQSASKHIDPPESWADPDCERLRRAVRTAAGQQAPNNTMNRDQLSVDEVAVYKLILHQWNSDARTLNVANRTFPLDAISSDLNCECLRTLDAQNLASVSHSFHHLTRDVFPEEDIRLVDPHKHRALIHTSDPYNGMAEGKSVEEAVNDAFGSGLFSLSEIAFDKDHRHALVSYSFVCGSLCGSGGTWLVEKIDGVWKRVDPVCGGWVS